MPEKKLKLILTKAHSLEVFDASKTESDSSLIVRIDLFEVAGGKGLDNLLHDIKSMVTKHAGEADVSVSWSLCCCELHPWKVFKLV